MGDDDWDDLPSSSNQPCANGGVVVIFPGGAMHAALSDESPDEVYLSKGGRAVSFPEFTTLDTFEIANRGTAHVVRVPDDLLAERDPRQLRGEWVTLDGQRRRVAAVEAHCVEWRPGLEALRNVSLLLVEDASPVVLPVAVERGQG